MPTEPTAPEQTLPPAPELPWNVYFGRLHSHSAFSDGLSAVEDLFARAKADGLHFYAVTDHSDAFDNDDLGALGEDGTAVSAEWAAGRAAAAAVTDEGFLGLYGFEMSWPRDRRLGHIAVLARPAGKAGTRKAMPKVPKH